MSKIIFINIDKLQLSKEEDEYHNPLCYSDITWLLDKLSDYEKCIVQLYYLHDKTDITISRILKTTKDTIYYRRLKIVSKLKYLYMIYQITPKYYGLNKEETTLLREMHRTLRRPALKTFMFTKKLIAKIADEETRKVFNLIYNFYSLFKTTNKTLPKIGA